MVINFANTGGGGGGDYYTKAESDARFAPASLQEFTVTGDETFTVSANAFYVSVSQENYQVKQRFGESMWMDVGDVVTAGNEAIVSGVLRGAELMLEGNNSEVTIIY